MSLSSPHCNTPPVALLNNNVVGGQYWVLLNVRREFAYLPEAQRDVCSILTPYVKP